MAVVLGPHAVHLPDLAHREAAALAARFAEVTAGTTVVHTDVRDDNVLLTDDGRVLLCDWNWPARAAWLDTVFLLIGPAATGSTPTPRSPGALTAEVPAEHVDIVLALAVGYFFRHADQPVPSYSPWVREVQRWQGEVAWDWALRAPGLGVSRRSRSAFRRVVPHASPGPAARRVDLGR